jgi:hypothetical protein
MKAPNPRVAMLLSIGGVLVAGSAAALVNAKVLDGQSGGAATAATTSTMPTAVQLTTTPTVATVPVTAPPTTVPPTTAVPIVVTAPPTTTTTPTATTPFVPTVDTVPLVPAAGGTQATYRLGDAGTALLDTAGGRLTIVRVNPNPGWFVDRAESDGPASVEIRLESETGEVRFEASLVRGVVRISLRTDDNDNSGDGDGDDNGGDSGGDDNSGHGGDDDDDNNSGPGSGD